MQNGFAELVNGKDTPHLIDWIGRINERPAAKKMFAENPRERLERPAPAARSA
jgi:glutathione S-transferase